MQRRYERLQEAAAAATYKVSFLGNLAQSVGWFFSNMTMVSVAAAGALVVMEGHLSTGGLAACTLLAGRSVQPVLRTLGLWSQYQAISLAKARTAELFEPEKAGSPSLGEGDGQVIEAEEAAAVSQVPVNGSIHLDKVSFSYGAEEPLLFKDLSLKVEAGRLVGIKGGSGSGKTSLLMLLMGLLEADSGSVRIDGRDIGSFDAYRLRRQIAFLPQTATLFQGTILENLTLFESGEAVERALAAAKLIGVDDAIRHLPEGYQTAVGKGAPMELPVGLKQGIAIARALVRQPRIILFDEANSGLDVTADERLRAALESLKGECTILLVSHRPSLLKLADEVYDLAGGRLIPAREAPKKGAAAKIERLTEPREVLEKAEEEREGEGPSVGRGSRA